MADTTYTDQETVIEASWLNAINDFFYTLFGGATTASGARSSISAASSGANSDITSITGLTTPLAETQGGSGQSTYTQGDILVSDASNSLAKVSVGSTGQRLGSDGTDATWGSPSSLIASVSATGAAVDFDANTYPQMFDGTFNKIDIYLHNIVPTTDDRYLYMRYGTGAGPTYATTNYTSIVNYTGTGDTFGWGSAAASLLYLNRHDAAGGALGTAAGEFYSSCISFNRLGQSGVTSYNGMGGYIQANASFASLQLQGFNTTTAALTGIRFALEGGDDFASGTIEVYGY